MTSTSNRDPKPSVVTGYPARAPAPATGTAGTAYPYPPPPPPHNAPYFQNPNPNPYYPNPNPNPNPNRNYNSYYPNPNSNTSSYNTRLFFRRLLIVAVAVFVIIGAVTFIVWLVLRPKLPVFSISDLSVSSFNLTSSDSLSSEFNVNFTIRNPNSKMTIYYDQITARISYGGVSITQASLPPFYQQTGNLTEIRAKLMAVGEYVGNDVVNGIRSDRGSRDGTVRFNVMVISFVNFKARAWRTRNHVLRVFCDGIGVGFKNVTAGVGSMVGPAKRCQVGL